MTGLSGRLVRIERALRPLGTPAVCGACGLPHLRLPVSITLVEAITRRALNGEAVEVQLLCLCTPCCSEGHGIARLSHGLPPGGPRWSA